MHSLGLPPSMLDTLQRIQERLSNGHALKEVIEDFQPHNSADAAIWCRRLPAWDEYRGQYSPQVVSVARIISLRAMRTHGLMLSEDGRAVKKPSYIATPWLTPEPSLTFCLTIRGEQLRVEYTPDYFPTGGQDNFYFVSAQGAPQPHCLSSTGYLSHLAPHDAVAACGGPEAYAALYAEAVLRGDVKEFETLFVGKWPETKTPRRSKTSRQTTSPVAEQLPVVGEHTAQVIAEQEGKKTTSQPERQRTLFEEMP
jgi:hypothetical protein